MPGLEPCAFLFRKSAPASVRLKSPPGVGDAANWTTRVVFHEDDARRPFTLDAIGQDAQDVGQLVATVATAVVAERGAVGLDRDGQHGSSSSTAISGL